MHPLAGIRKLRNAVLRRLLYFWVRTEVAPAQLGTLAIDPDRPLCYVLDTRGFSDLLVLEQECRSRGLPSPTARIDRRVMGNWRNALSLRPPPRFSLTRQECGHKLQGLTASLRGMPAADLQLIPVSIFWGRAPAREGSWLKVYFSDTWTLTSIPRKLMTIVFQGRSTLVVFQRPLSLQKALGDAADPGEAVHHIQRDLGRQLDVVRAATIGPDVSHRSRLAAELMGTPAVRRSIDEEVARSGGSHEVVKKRARKIVFELAADCTHITVQLMLRLLNAFWNRFYNGIELHHGERLKQLPGDCQIVYLPCHRSHVDYLLLSYAIYHQQRAIPYIAAGDNLNLPLIGRILRNGGAFFIRRQFKGDPLYSNLVFEYLAANLRRGSPIEFFIEGGRSRTGRQLPPKSGMLAMSVRAFLRDRARPVIYLPVYIGYEKIVEGPTYIGELGGHKKKGESVLGLFRALGALRGRFGCVHLSFGEPIPLEGLVDEIAPEWRSLEYDDSKRPDWLFPVVSTLAGRARRGINRACKVNAINLISLALLSSARQTMDREELIRFIERLKCLLRDHPNLPDLVVPEQSGEWMVARARELKFVTESPHPLGDLVGANPGNSVLLTYYRNNVLHLFAVSATVACCFLERHSLARDRVVDIVALVYPYLDAELCFGWASGDMHGHIQAAIDQLIAQGLLSGTAERLRAPPNNSDEVMHLHWLALAIQPNLERYFLTLALMVDSGAGVLDRDALETRCQLLAQRLSTLFGLDAPDFFDRGLFTQFVDTLIDEGRIAIDGEGKIGFGEDLFVDGERARILLSRQTRHSIVQLLR